jgi:DNA polymerase-1
LLRLRGQEVPDVAAEFKAMKLKDLQDACTARCLGSEGTKGELIKRLVDDTSFQLSLSNSEAHSSEDLQSQSVQQPLGRFKDMAIVSLGLKPVKFTKSGLPAVSMDALRDLAGNPRDDPPRYGPAYEHFGGGSAGKEACEALDSLVQMSSIDSMLSNFIQPLQDLADENSRVHCSLNINTETGRLSARRPNLQNQPALEKDNYKIRAAFRAEEGKRLIVADYGQLELRLLAHMTDCKSMIKAFKEGGCFHSRTAVGMFDHVKEAVDRGDVLLEWDYSKGMECLG